jgi:hypothetical protein
MYTDGRLVVSFQMIQPRPGEVTLHAAVSRVSGVAPSAKDMRQVESAFFTADLGSIDERNDIYRCSDLIRNLWQKVQVSVVTGDLLTPEMVERMKAVGNG